MDTSQYQTAIAKACAYTETYAANPQFRKYWLGFNEESRNSRAQQLRAWGTLMSIVTDTLEKWRILDIGCGDGRWLRTFLEYGAHPEDCYGVDISDARFDIGRLRNPLISLQKTDGITLPFDDATFDLVTQFVCFSCFPSQELRQTVANEICRVVKPGGYVFWWDHTTIEVFDEPRIQFKPADFFPWPIRKMNVGLMPWPRECMRRFFGRRNLFSLIADLFRYPDTHTAALIGPKP